jgi:tRNA nucleotidyltransferase (CCA-adding enzyme)
VLHLQDLTPSEVLAALRDAPGVAAVFDALSDETGVHAVGGAVRDVLLGHRPSEVDLVVTGDATDLARRLAGRVGGRLRVHERFKTATLELGGAHLDLASTRRERYPRPGALPEVELGATLSEDLDRRDFTINAIAVSLAGSELTAHPRALADLRARSLRVLHPGSFRDDPTRLIRLCRYGGRLGFDIEPSTRELLHAALEGRALETVSGERIGRELRLAAAEPQPATMRILAATGILAAILGDVLDDWSALAAALELCPPDGRCDLLVLAAAGVAQAPVELAERLRQLAFAREEADTIVRVAGAAPVLAHDLDALAQASPSRVVARLAREPVEAVALAGALSRSPQAAATAERYLGELRRVRSELSGHDLRRAGLRGPEVGRGLEAALSVALDSPGAGREEQLAAALAAAGRSPEAAG